MAKYEKPRLKLRNTELKKWNLRQKKAETTLKLTSKNFQEDESFLITRQKIKLKNGFANKMLTDIKLSKTDLGKIIQ